jgi:hypothetical protein
MFGHNRVRMIRQTLERLAKALQTSVAHRHGDVP